MVAINSITYGDVNRFQEEFVTVREPYSVNVNAMGVYQTLATRSAIYPGKGTPLGLAYVALKLNGEAGEFAEHVGKALRDDSLLTEFLDKEESSAFPETVTRAAGVRKVYSYPSYELTPERRELIIKEIGDCLWYLSAACNELGISLAEAATTNLRKLADRSERNALRGSGDER